MPPVLQGPATGALGASTPKVTAPQGGDSANLVHLKMQRPWTLDGDFAQRERIHKQRKRTLVQSSILPNLRSASLQNSSDGIEMGCGSVQRWCLRPGAVAALLGHLMLQRPVASAPPNVKNGEPLQHFKPVGSCVLSLCERCAASTPPVATQQPSQGSAVHACRVGKGARAQFPQPTWCLWRAKAGTSKQSVVGHSRADGAKGKRRRQGSAETHSRSCWLLLGGNVTLLDRASTRRHGSRRRTRRR